MLHINEAFYHLQGKDMFVQKNHFHNEIELIHVIKGNGIVLKNDKTYPLQSQCVYVIDARNAHIVYPQPEDCNDYVRNKIVLDADSFEFFCSKIGIYNLTESLFNGPPVSVGDNQRIDFLYKTICDFVSLKQNEESGFVLGYIVELIHLIYSNRDCGQQYAQNKIIQKILDFVSSKNGITSLREVSDYLYMNKFYICHMFKEKTGQNLSEYIADKRHDYAVKLLKNNIYSIDEIAFKCGYSATSCFIRFFKSKKGISPAQFRKNKKYFEW